MPRLVTLSCAHLLLQFSCSPDLQLAGFTPSTQTPRAGPAFNIDCKGGELVNSLPTTLNQNDQYDDKEYSGNRPNNRYIVHVNPPFSQCVRYF